MKATALQMSRWSASPLAGAAAGLSEEQVHEVLCRTRAHELRLARGFKECRDMAPEQIEDLYQDTILALLRRPHRNAEHVLCALRIGIKQRANKAHRDERRRLEILRENAAGIERVAQAKQDDDGPERRALISEQRQAALLVLEQMGGLERRVFVAYVVYGLGYAAIAELYGLSAGDVRQAVRGARGWVNTTRSHDRSHNRAAFVRLLSDSS